MTYKLSEIFDIKELQELSASFTRLTGTHTVILDIDGNILTASGWQQICTKFHRVNPITEVRCKESDFILAEKVNAKEQYNVCRCKNGLVDVAVPIIIDGAHMGNLFTGQFLFEPPNEQYFIRQAEECGFNKDEYLEALSKVPVFTEEYVKMIVDFLLRLAMLIGETGLAKKKTLESMERDLRDSEEKYRLLFTHENDAIFLCDAETYEFIDSNDAWCNLYGYSREEMKGASVTIISAEPEKSFAIAKKAKTTSRQRVTNILHRHKDGTVFSVELSIGFFTYKGRDVFCIISRDITERIRIEEALKQFTINLENRVAEEIEKNRLKDQLMYEQSRHMAMGELLVNIAHQWRQPLAAIGLLVQDIRDAYMCNELNEGYLDKSITDVMSELVALSNTIDGFKDFYLSNQQKEVLRIKDVIESALSITNVYFEVKDIIIEKEIDDGLTLNVVPSEFAQVILNILSNVRDVFDQRHVSTRIVKINSYKDTSDGKVVITITDNGGGVREDIIGRIFDPYFTTKDKSRGTGLGLYITKLIVEKSMKGAISVRNIDGWCEFKIVV
ncbi:MAG: PocR ligand-binding domain-containing protein [Nitrospirae bacterium]|nr:PocR ligand-binding domain-containing protein [Nitrospirota bacterium]MBF0535226.1 PocR ligand-binding domain-containing protein [Nitrospirota bacterium]MBF0615294.1 PocR ligand-binding domain-containing protein [Nitrospirota bacterium]